MGAYLSEPNVEKISDDGSCEELSYGASAMQGWRVGMEVSINMNEGEGEDVHCTDRGASASAVQWFFSSNFTGLTV